MTGKTRRGRSVLTYHFWRNSLHSDPSVIGKSVRLESVSGARSATIVGVLEPSVPYPVATEIIANVVTSPHHLSATMVTGREHRMTEVFARLAPGATLDRRAPSLRTRYGAMMAAHPEVYKPDDHYTIDVTRMHEQINARANTILWMLFAASGLLFVIASSNVANLVLARTVRRESELAVRCALGASTAVLRRSLLAEGLVLCGSGAMAAVMLAVPMVKVLGRYAARFSVRANDLTLDFSLVWFGIGLALVAAVFLAYIPRLPSANAPQRRAHRPRCARCGRKRPRLRIFAVTQIAASFLLLAGACVLMKTLFVLEQTRPPFDSANVLAVNLAGDVVWTRRRNRCMSSIARRNAGSARFPEWSMSPGFQRPWRDDQGLNISFTFAAQGARARTGRITAPSSGPYPGIFRDIRRADCGGPRLQQRRQGRVGARGHHQPEPGAAALSGAERTQPQAAVDGRGDEVYRHQLRAAADHCRGA